MPVFNNIRLNKLVYLYQISSFKVLVAKSVIKGSKVFEGDTAQKSVATLLLE